MIRPVRNLKDEVLRMRRQSNEKNEDEGVRKGMMKKRGVEYVYVSKVEEEHAKQNVM